MPKRVAAPLPHSSLILLTAPEAQVGRRHRILLKGARLGCTEQFAEVAFREDGVPGMLVEALIKHVAAGRLAA